MAHYHKILPYHLMVQIILQWSFHNVLVPLKVVLQWDSLKTGYEVMLAERC